MCVVPVHAGPMIVLGLSLKCGMEQIWHRIFCVHEIMESTAHGVNTGLTLTFIDRCVIITKFNCIPQHHMISKKLIHKDHVMLRNQLHYQGVGNRVLK